ncbi:hypothetical protein, partial [Mesorhizobium sp. M1143]|uniref:hypothetical protein n=1 Tax=Mesorhizobium sp. M1143 TaxID=2957061 RepID=UPI003337951D
GNVPPIFLEQGSVFYVYIRYQIGSHLCFLLRPTSRSSASAWSVRTLSTISVATSSASALFDDFGAATAFLLSHGSQRLA